MAALTSCSPHDIVMRNSSIALKLYSILLLAVVMLLPAAALAYVDPGILSALYQTAYIAIFAVITAFILRPWSFVKSRFSRLFGKKQSPDENKEESETRKKSKN